MLTIAEPCARPKVERFLSPLRDGRVFLLRFPALRTGLLSLPPSPRLGSNSEGGLRRTTICQQHMRRWTDTIPALKAFAVHGSDPQSHQLTGLADGSGSRIEELFVMSHRRLCDEFRRPNKAKSSGVEYEVIEQRVFDIRIEIAS